VRYNKTVTDRQEVTVSARQEVTVSAINVVVTQDDIAQSDPGIEPGFGITPIEVALRKQSTFSEVTLGIGEVYGYQGGMRYVYRLPPEAVTYIEAFEGKEVVAPTTFTIILSEVAPTPHEDEGYSRYDDHDRFYY